MKIGITGCKGRMGAMLVQEIMSGEYKGAELAGGTVLPQDVGAGDFFITGNAEELFMRSDAVIDFTSPEATLSHAGLAAKHGKALIVGTTGMKEDQERALENAAQNTAIIYAPNMSVGVNVLLAAVEQIAARLTDSWDIEIFESHHKHKVDAPSGTALALGKAAARGRGQPFENAAEYARHGITGQREAGKIGFSVARGGDVVGDHTVYFYGDAERIELTHRATSRSLFAKGAIRAALWAGGRKPGFYSMKDVLGL